jgi:hypothetical protein
MKQDALLEEQQPMSLMPLMEQQPKAKSIKIETPIGTVESDSGNHMIDVVTIIGLIAVLYIGKKLVNKYVR